MSLLGSRDVGLTCKAANWASVNPKLPRTCSRLTAVNPKTFGTLIFTRPPAALRALAVISLFSLGKVARISLLILMLPPSETPASVVIRLLRRNWMSCACRLIFAPVPDTVVPSILALLSRAIEFATILMLPARPLPVACTVIVAPSLTISRSRAFRFNEPAFAVALGLVPNVLPTEASIVLTNRPLFPLPLTEMRSALTVIFPTSPAPKELVETIPPSRTVRIGVSIRISPPRLELKVPEVSALAF